MKKKADGSIVLTMACPITDTLVRWVMQMAECVTVIKPKGLREMVVEKAKKLVENQKLL